MLKTKEEKHNLDNLTYIGLDIRNIPEFLLNYKKICIFN